MVSTSTFVPASSGAAVIFAGGVDDGRDVRQALHGPQRSVAFVAVAQQGEHASQFGDGLPPVAAHAPCGGGSDD